MKKQDENIKKQYIKFKLPSNKTIKQETFQVLFKI